MRPILRLKVRGHIKPSINGKRRSEGKLEGMERLPCGEDWSEAGNIIYIVFSPQPAAIFLQAVYIFSIFVDRNAFSAYIFFIFVDRWQ